MLNSPTTLHPNPQLARSHWIDLRGPWSFAYDNADRGLEELWQARDDVFPDMISVPFPPESPASGIGDHSFHPVVWYRRAFRMAPEDAGRRLILHFGAVDYRAQVWVNGWMVAAHEGGHTPFRADITAVLRGGGDQIITVRAEDRADDLSQPRGKQDWQERPHEIWYHRTTGIWQPVWIEPVAPLHVTRLRWIPDLERCSLGVVIGLSSHDPSSRVRLRLSLQGETLAQDTLEVTGPEIRHHLDLSRCKVPDEGLLWRPEHPNLIEAEITLLRGGEVVDEVTSYAGIRGVWTGSGRFLLNGRPYYLRMALEQGYWPESHLAAPGDELLRREAELAKALGFNGLRIHQKVEDPRFLYWCDRLGLIVWGEMANAFEWSRAGAERLTREWLEVVERDASHPCIAAWVPINESWGVPELVQAPDQQHFVRALYHLTRALDPTRPVIANDGWEYVIGDIAGVHDYTSDGATIRERYGTPEALQRTLREGRPRGRSLTVSGPIPDNTPVILSEFGGISLAPEHAHETWYGYGTVDSPAAYLAKYRELVDAVLDCPPLAGFCYTQLADTLQETNGLLTADRRCKLDPAELRAINQQPAP
jgi:beta-galactosidase/beta-glucuronidase